MSGRKQNRQTRGLKMTAPSAIRYTGSVRGSLVNQSTQPIEVTISYAPVPNGTRSVYAFAGPVTPAPNSIAVNNTPQFASYLELYDEFRVLGLQVLTPPATELTFMAGYRAVEDPPAIGTTFAEFSQLSGFKFCSTTHQTSMTVKMDGADEAGWLSTDLTGTLHDFKYTGIAVGAVSTLPANVATWRVQFRSTKPVTQQIALRKRVQDLPFNFQEVDERVEDEESHPVLLTKEQRALLRSSLKL